MGLQIDTGRAVRTPSEQLQLVHAVYSAGINDESDWIEWKSTLDLSSARGIFSVARAILGLANRMPDAARPYMEGCGYILVGVAPGQLNGVAAIDPTVLNDKVSSYISEPAPQWSAAWVSVDVATVLIITVEPPGDGDPIYSLGKSYESSDNGTIFVRKGAATRPASSAMLRQLQARLGHAGKRVGVELHLVYGGEPRPMGAFDRSEADGWLERFHVLPSSPEPRATEGEVDLSDLPLRTGLSLNEIKKLETRYEAGEDIGDGSLTRLLYSFALIKTSIDALSASGARSIIGGHYYDDDSVDDMWEVADPERAYMAVLEACIMKMIHVGTGLTVLRLSNPTETNYPAVEVRITLPMLFLIFSAGDGYPAGTGLWAHRQLAMKGVNVPAHAAEEPEFSIVTDPDGSTSLRFEPVHLRPFDVVDLPPFHIVPLGHPAGDEIRLPWTATSTGVDGRVLGEVTIRLAAPPHTISALLPL